jgi:hypothetical protein
MSVKYYVRFYILISWMEAKGNISHSRQTKNSIIKGLGHEIEFKYLDKKIDNSLPKRNLYWFLNLEDEPLMSCRLCHFPRS